MNAPVYGFNLFQEQAMRTAKEMTQEQDIIHATLGITSEAGELADAVKKSFAYDQPLDVDNMIEELGDVLWYVALMCHGLRIPMEFPAMKCIEKLYTRYPEKFTNEHAAERLDKVDEVIDGG